MLAVKVWLLDTGPVPLWLWHCRVGSYAITSLESAAVKTLESVGSTGQESTVT